MCVHVRIYKEKYEEQVAADPEKADALKNLASNLGFDISNWDFTNGYPVQ